MLQLNNKTPFAANLSVLPNEQGIDTLFVVASARFKWNQRWLLEDEQAAPTEADIYSGEPALSSIVKPSEYHLGKIATDIIVIGDACALHGQQVRTLDVSIQVGLVNHQLKVFGDRVWQSGSISQAQIFERMPITYERAYGGVCIADDGQTVSAEERNPVGVGHLGQYHKSQFDNTFLPNIEDPNNLIQDLKDTPQPAGFGAIAPNWQPRVSFAGTYDDAWITTRSPYLPTDFDKRFFNCAPQNLIYPGYIAGGEPVVIKGMHPQGAVQFTVPQVNLIARANIANQIIPLIFNIETLIIDPNNLSISLTWRASTLAGKKMAKISEIELLMGRQAQAA